MWNGKTVAVVVPAYNEERLIARTLRAMPTIVDTILVVNDGSRDKTKSEILSVAATDSRVVLVDHEKNRGLGQALITGYVRARELEADVTVIMAGDGQMGPADLERIVAPIAAGEADYVKGNRLLHEAVIGRMPTYRFLGNATLTLLTKFATGYWHSMDPQCGYTAISRQALARIPIETMIKGYGYNAHILHMLNLEDFRVADTEVEPIYGEEVSKIKLYKYIPRVSWLLIRLTVRRLVHKYALRDFHPLVLFYGLAAFLLAGTALPLLARFLWLFHQEGVAPRTTLLLLSFVLTNGFFSLFFAMWMDMEDNKSLWLRIRRTVGRAKMDVNETTKKRRVTSPQPTTTLSC